MIAGGSVHGQDQARCNCRFFCEGSFSVFVHELRLAHTAGLHKAQVGAHIFFGWFLVGWFLFGVGIPVEDIINCGLEALEIVCVREVLIGNLIVHGDHSLNLDCEVQPLAVFYVGFCHSFSVKPVRTEKFIEFHICYTFLFCFCKKLVKSQLLEFRLVAH